MCLLNSVPAEQLSTQCVLKYFQGQVAHFQNEPIQSSDVKVSFPETSALNSFVSQFLKIF